MTTAFESLMVLSWIFALIGLYLMVRSPKPMAVGVFVLPLVLGLVISGQLASPRDGWDQVGSATRFWGTVHGLFLLAGRGLDLRGVRRRSDVPGAVEPAEAQAALPVRVRACLASNNRNG